MIVGGLGDGWGEFRAGLRQLSGLSRLLRGLLRPQAVAGAQPELSSGAAGAGWGAAQRREPVGIGGHLGPGDAAFSDRGPVGRCRGHRSAAGIPGPQAGSPRGGVGVGRQRLSQAGTEVGGGSPAVPAGWGRWPTARRGCSWPTSARWDRHWWTRGCICPRVGSPTRTGVRRRVCPRSG